MVLSGNSTSPSCKKAVLGKNSERYGLSRKGLRGGILTRVLQPSTTNDILERREGGALEEKIKVWRGAALN